MLVAGGAFGLVDNVVPDDGAVARFVNGWEKRRDPSHARCLSLNEWLGLLTSSGFEIGQSELVAKRMGFTAWADNMSLGPELRQELLEELAGAGDDVASYLRPELGSAGGGEEGAAFHLTEAIVVASSAQ